MTDNHEEKLLPWEEWRPIKGFFGYYEVSNFGRVKGLRHAHGPKKPHIRKLTLSKDGYLKIGLTKKNKVKRFCVHRLVAAAFIGDKPSEGMEINHINCIKTDNRPDNLEWVTKSQQQMHASKHNRSNLIVYSDETIAEARNLYDDGLSTTEISAITGANPHTVWLWVTGKARGYGERKNLSRTRRFNGYKQKLRAALRGENEV